jgi:hypothetical protein
MSQGEAATGSEIVGSAHRLDLYARVILGAGVIIGGASSLIIRAYTNLGFSVTLITAALFAILITQIPLFVPVLRNRFVIWKSTYPWFSPIIATSIVGFVLLPEILPNHSETGPIGPQGIQGERGAPGPQGPQGLPGAPATPATLDPAIQRALADESRLAKAVAAIISERRLTDHLNQVEQLAKRYDDLNNKNLTTHPMRTMGIRTTRELANSIEETQMEDTKKQITNFAVNDFPNDREQLVIYRRPISEIIDKYKQAIASEQRTLDDWK